MEKKQTAVELLEQQLKERYSLMNSEPLFDQAKAMEKEQMIEFATDTHNLNYYKNKSFRKEAEDYYNETYGETKN
jgi:hypothetical protein